MKFSRLAGAGLVLAFLAATVRAETNSEFWPELDTWIRLNDATRLLLITNGTRDRDSGDQVNSEGQAYVDYRYSDRISFRAGYVYSDTPPATPDKGHSIERRWVFDFSYNWKLDESTQADQPRPHGPARHRGRFLISHPRSLEAGTRDEAGTPDSDALWQFGGILR